MPVNRPAPESSSTSSYLAMQFACTNISLLYKMAAQEITTGFSCVCVRAFFFFFLPFWMMLLIHYHRMIIMAIHVTKVNRVINWFDSVHGFCIFFFFLLSCNHIWRWATHWKSCTWMEDARIEKGVTSDYNVVAVCVCADELVYSVWYMIAIKGKPVQLDAYWFQNMFIVIGISRPPKKEINCLKMRWWREMRDSGLAGCAGAVGFPWETSAIFCNANRVALVSRCLITTEWGKNLYWRNNRIS